MTVRAGDLCRFDYTHGSYNPVSGLVDEIIDEFHPMIVLSVHSVDPIYAKVLTVWGTRLVEVESLVAY